MSGGRQGGPPTRPASIPEPSNGKPGWESFGIPEGFWVSERLPVAVVQPLAGKHELREQTVALLEAILHKLDDIERTQYS